MEFDLRMAPAFAVVISAAVLAGCGQPDTTTSGVVKAGCSVEGVTDYSPGRSSAESPKEAIVTWVRATRTDLGANVRAYGSAATQDRAAVGDQATLDGLRSVEEILAQNIGVPVEATGRKATLVGVDHGGHSVAITVSRGPLHEGPDWMVTEYHLDLDDQACPSPHSSR